MKGFKIIKIRIINIDYKECDEECSSLSEFCDLTVGSVIEAELYDNGAVWINTAPDDSKSPNQTTLLSDCEFEVIE